MKNDEIWEWQCQMHVYSCWLYEIDDKPALTDHDYDWLCRLLLTNYDRTPDWYRSRVTRDDLAAGTGAAIAATLTPTEIAAAKWWRDELIPAHRKEADERRSAIERSGTGTERKGPRRKKGAGAGRGRKA